VVVLCVHAWHTQRIRCYPIWTCAAQATNVAYLPGCGGCNYYKSRVKILPATSAAAVLYWWQTYTVR